MNKNIERASNKCKTLYKNSLKLGATEEDKKKYRDCRNTYNKLKGTSRTEYYAKKCEEYSKNMKKL